MREGLGDQGGPGVLDRLELEGAAVAPDVAGAARPGRVAVLVQVIDPGLGHGLVARDAARVAQGGSAAGEDLEQLLQRHALSLRIDQVLVVTEGPEPVGLHGRVAVQGVVEEPLGLLDTRGRACLRVVVGENVLEVGHVATRPVTAVARGVASIDRELIRDADEVEALDAPLRGLVALATGEGSVLRVPEDRPRLSEPVQRLAPLPVSSGVHLEAEGAVVALGHHEVAEVAAPSLLRVESVIRPPLGVWLVDMATTAVAHHLRALVEGRQPVRRYVQAVLEGPLTLLGARHPDPLGRPPGREGPQGEGKEEAVCQPAGHPVSIRT